MRRRSVGRHLHRAVYAKHLKLASPPNPLYFAGSVAGRRYTPVGGPGGLYLSFDPATTITELRLLTFAAGEPVSQRHDPVTVFSANAKVADLLDLTDDETCDILGITRQELDEDWETRQAAYLAGSGPRPFGQLLALAAHAMGSFAGIIYQSRRSNFGTNVVFFPDRMYVDEFVEVIDDDVTHASRLTGSRERRAGRL